MVFNEYFHFLVFLLNLLVYALQCLGKSVEDATGLLTLLLDKVQTLIHSLTVLSCLDFWICLHFRILPLIFRLFIELASLAHLSHKFCQILVIDTKPFVFNDGRNPLADFMDLVVDLEAVLRLSLIDASNQRVCLAVIR